MKLKMYSSKSLLYDFLVTEKYYFGYAEGQGMLVRLILCLELWLVACLYLIGILNVLNDYVSSIAYG